MPSAYPGPHPGVGRSAGGLGLAADVDVVGLVDQVEAALAVPDQVGEEPHGVVAQGLEGLGVVAVAGGPRLVDAAADAVADLGVLAPEPGHAVGHAGRVL